MKLKSVATALIAVVLTLTCGEALAKKERPVEAKDLMKREETMVLNLNRGPQSTKFYILESIRKTKEMQKHLDRAQRQVEQTDANYAKAKNRPDDRTMNGTVQRLIQCQKTLAKLEEDLAAANQELKVDIQSTLIQH